MAQPSFRSRLHLGTALLFAVGAVGCASDASSPAPIVGSGKVTEATFEAMFVEKVTVDLPMHAFVYNGQPRQVLVRGEDNLIDQIDVEEVDVGTWRITADPKLVFEQHQDIEIEVPYIEMVQLALDGNVEIGDNPSGMWQ